VHCPEPLCLEKSEDRLPTRRHTTRCEDGADLLHPRGHGWDGWMTVRSATGCISLLSHSSPATVCPGRRLILYIVAIQGGRKVGREGQGTTPCRRSGGLVLQREGEYPRLAPVSSFLRPQLGLGRPSDACPLAPSQPFLVLAPRRAGPLLFRPPMLLPTSFQARSTSFPHELTTSKPLLSPKIGSKPLSNSFVGLCEHLSNC
jgi:hypothetical protein